MLDKAEYSAFQSTLNSPIVSYRIYLSDINSSPMNFMIVSVIFCVLGLTSQFLNIPLCIKHKSKPMPIYCVVMSGVKQESLANAKVRISTQQQCMYEGP